MEENTVNYIDKHTLARTTNRLHKCNKEKIECAMALMIHICLQRKRLSIS